MSNGRFITFEGGEGAGKSTQVRRLAEALRARGIDVLTTREPGGSEGAEQIRRLLVEGSADRWDGLTETLLHYAARRDHLRRVIRPALAAGTWVISDRFNDSTRAYQGYGHGLPQGDLAALYQLVSEGLSPDLTIVLDLPVEVGLQRAGLRGGDENRYEGMASAFHQRLRTGFLTIAAAEPERCRVISADQPLDAVHGEIVAVIEQSFKELAAAS
ncbi:dTMP kinase [Insolitispirillum peregrinum]|uniref:Thymidylate kinase n=1 Tax=Insolitispirillum peregrinum TaxID=80876 RepID=A0A1N7IWR9_9PROT|nr:dTMP kinase [Insolitispirillum peregrinum]SIS41530.1 thymidylate kinase [Insolitispirillum peregrinum]